MFCFWISYNKNVIYLKIVALFFSCRKFLTHTQWYISTNTNIDILRLKSIVSTRLNKCNSKIRILKLPYEYMKHFLTLWRSHNNRIYVCTCVCIPNRYPWTSLYCYRCPDSPNNRTKRRMKNLNKGCKNAMRQCLLAKISNFSARLDPLFGCL